MLKNYLKISLRNLYKYKGFSVINILGLAMSMSICLLIIMVLKDQSSFDRFHVHKDRIYRVNSLKLTKDRDTELHGPSPSALASILRAEYPGVEKAVRMEKMRGLASYEGRDVSVRGLYAEPSFFDIFSFELVAGDPAQALSEPRTMIVSEETAAKFFGTDDPLGKQVMLENGGLFTITGVLREPPAKSHLSFEAIVSFATLEAEKPRLNVWGNDRAYTYVLLQEGTSPEALETYLQELISHHNSEREGGTNLHAFSLQALTDINLGPIMNSPLGWSIPWLFALVFGGLGLILMFTACFNYISLSLARSLKRAKEIGIRKVFGAHRSQIIKQFLIEAVLVSLFSLGLAYVFLLWLVPQFNSMSGIGNTQFAIAPELIQDVSLYLLFLVFSVAIGLVAGLYPALYFSAYRPARVLKGLSTIRGFSKLTLRKALMISQFVLSLIFIITGTLAYEQVDYLLEADYGFNKDQVINVRLQGVPYDVFRNEVIRHPHITGVSAASLLPLGGSNSTREFSLPGQEHPMSLSYYAIDYDFLSNLEIPLVAGRGFSEAFATDEAQAIMLNETAVRAYGLGTPAEAVGQFVGDAENQPYQVIGVVEDFYHKSVFDAIGPVMLRYVPRHFSFANLRVRADETEDIVAYLNEVWAGLGTTFPLSYTFYDVQITEDLSFMRELGGLVGLMALLSIVIACLGLLGMVSYSTETRIKEIGIRKVLGADVGKVVLLLSKDFVVMLLIAIAIGAPLGWLLNNLWLQEFSIRVAMGPGHFAGGIALMLTLALGIICSQTVKIAQTNPADTLRHQ